jgi:PIN domain nuclease of toxin-antitoxin system
MICVLDTHALVWHLTGSARLGRNAGALLCAPSNRIVIPTIAMAELKYLHHRSRIPLSYAEVLTSIENDERCILFPLTEPVLSLLPAELEIHDAIICATAILLQEAGDDAVRVLTCDRQIAGSGLVKSVW